ncbi:helix-turn-helix domain-containing protein [Paremcibacter congregatus]|uniref:MerR family transcriptional regulator n=1 Tax=Paremcibacter congregatus TaxID=2043170 RepID=UPI0030EC1452|tara:strand:+ start:9489 stop:9896 length:408 start_codon:yes stop_codon:yes gene_type:complete
MRSQKREFTIGILSKYSEVNIETIRYYEQIGIMPSPPRSASGYRQYNESHQRRLSFIRRSRELGFPLEDIRGLLTLVDDKSYSCAEVQQLTLDHLDTTRRKIADLQRLEAVLDEMASTCDGGLAPDCPIIDSLSE